MVLLTLFIWIISAIATCTKLSAESWHLLNALMFNALVTSFIFDELARFRRDSKGNEDEY